MNPSRIFILRPVATTMLMVGVVLAGAAAYRLLPISALPEVDYPTIQVTTFYPGRQPGRDGLVGDGAARASIRTGAGPAADDIDQFRRELGDHAAVRSQPQHRRRRTGGAAVDQRVRHVSARGPADAADLQQDQSGRYADPDAGADVGRPSAVEGRRPCRHAAGAEDLAAAGRGAGQHQRRAETRRPDSGESHVARGVRPQSGGSAQRDRRRQRQPGEGELRRAASGVPDRSQRSAALEQRLRRARHRLPERRPGHADRRRDRRRRRRERPPGRLDERDARGHPEHSTAAGREHHCRRRPHQAAAAAAHAIAALVGQGHRPHRSDDHDSRVGERRAVRAHADGRPGRDGDVRVPAQRRRPRSFPASPFRCRSSAPSA